VQRHGWVTSSDERGRIEASLGELSGRPLSAVRYVEMVGDGTPLWDVGSFHSIDFGVEIDLEGQVTWSITWQQRGHNETLLAYAGTIASAMKPDAELAVWDLTPLWRERFPEGFAGIDCAWTRHVFGPADTGDTHESDACLVSLVLNGRTGEQAVITLGGESQYQAGVYTYLADNVAVFLSVAEARRANVILPGDQDIER
jgi:hypothetical protein